MKTLTAALVGAAVAAAGAAHAAGNPIQTDPIRAKVASPVFLGPTPACPAGRVHTGLVSESGAVIGSSLLCVASEAFDETTATFVETATLVLHLPGGEMVASATLADDFSGYPVVQQAISGTVLDGAGRYRGASGALSGAGTIVFDEDGVPHPDSTIVIDLD
jgi:hypothetical protein